MSGSKLVYTSLTPVKASPATLAAIKFVATTGNREIAAAVKIVASSMMHECDRHGKFYGIGNCPSCPERGN